MNVLFIYPRFKHRPSGSPPLGISFLAAYLEKKHHDVAIIDTTFDTTWGAVGTKLSKYNPDLICIYAMTLWIQDALKAAALAKKEHAGVPVILGGPHATIMPKQVLENENVDMVCIGEGELVLAELLANLRNGNLSKINGLGFKHNGNIKINSPRHERVNLDELPFPALHLLPIDDYIEYSKKNVDHVYVPELPMIVSRGCPFNCAYCQPTLRQIFGNKWRIASPKRVVDEVEYLVNTYSVKSVAFTDDTFTVNHKWVTRVCDEVDRRGISVKWRCNSRVDTINRKIIERMKKSGCWFISFGVEAGTDHIRNDILNKGVTTKQVLKAFEDAKKAGLRTCGYFMIGSPDESRDDVLATINLAKELGPDSAQFTITTPIPGTNLYKLAVEKELIRSANLEDYDYYTHSVMVTGKLSSSEIEELHKLAVREVNLAPGKLIPLAVRRLRSVKSFSEIKHMLLFFIEKLLLKR